MTSGQPKGLPLALQIAILMMVSLVIAQVGFVMVVVLVPPPPKVTYRLDEIAQALAASTAPVDATHRLDWSVHDTLPDPPVGRGLPRSGAHIAAMMGVSRERVILVLPAPFPATLLHPELESLPPARGDHGTMHVVRIFGEEGPEPPFRRGASTLSGAFVAAYHRPDGRWTLVRSPKESFPNDWQRRIIAWLVGYLLLVAPLSYFFARRITAPLSAFARAADQLGKDPNSPHIALSGPAEIGIAARAFNDMQARLTRYIEDRTGMVGAISHDLRTPLARMRFKLEAAPQPMKQSVLSDISQMEAMIASVLAFIRDATAGRPREPLDLLSLVECLVDEAHEAGQDVTLAESSPVTITADALGLQRLIGNLIDNALKYGLRARVSLRSEEGEAVVEVRDDGPGLNRHDIERVFQPFFRAESARTLDGSGVGLGLAVARSIARAHGGEVLLISSPQGLTAQVRLPI